MKRHLVRFKQRSQRTIIVFSLLSLAILAAIGGGVYAAFGGAGKTVDAANNIDLQKGLVGWWKLDGNPNDSTPYGADGTPSNVTPASDRHGNTSGAYSFNGTSSGIDLGNPSQLQVTGSQTISMWIKPADFSARRNPFAKAYGGEGTITQETNGTLNYYYGTAGGNTTPYQGFGTTGTLTLNSWNHVVIVRDLSAMTLTWYINGSVDRSGAASYSAATASSLHAFIGQGYVSPYSGSMDDVREYNRALSPAEVTALYKEYDSQTKAASGENGLMGWWKLDGNTNDSSPYARDGTPSGTLAPATDRKNTTNGAMNFSGATSSYFDTGYNYPYQNFTASIWVDPDGTGPASFSTIMSNARDCCSTYNGFQMDYNHTSLMMSARLWGGGSSAASTLQTPITLNTWTLLTITYDSSTFRLYKNGSQVTSASVSATIGSSAYDVFIGKMGAISSNYSFGGSLDDARIYNRALSAAEVTNLYASYNSQISVGGSPNSSVQLSKGLVGDWPFNGNANDVTPFGNDGTVNGATLTTDRKGRANSAYATADSSGWINVGSPSAFSNLTSSGFTYSVWLMRTQDSTAHWPEIMGASNTHIYYGIRSQNYGNSISFEYGNGTFDGTHFTATYFGSCSTLAFNQWHLYTVTYSGTTLTTYCDGSLAQTSTGVVLDPTFGGLSFTTSGSGWIGNMDDGRVWDRALTATEAQALYQEYR